MLHQQKWRGCDRSPGCEEWVSRWAVLGPARGITSPANNRGAWLRGAATALKGQEQQAGQMLSYLKAFITPLQGQEAILDPPPHAEHILKVGDGTVDGCNKRKTKRRREQAENERSLSLPRRLSEREGEREGCTVIKRK